MSYKQILKTNEFMIRENTYLRFLGDEMMIWFQPWNSPTSSSEDHIGWVNHNDVVCVLKDGITEMDPDECPLQGEFYVEHLPSGMKGYVFGIPQNPFGDTAPNWAWELVEIH